MTEFKKQVNVTQVLVGGSDIEDSQGRDLLYKKVNTRSELPAQGESDGDTYLIIDEDVEVEWDVQTMSWISPMVKTADNTITSTKQGIKVNHDALLKNDYKNFTMQGWIDNNQVSLSLTGTEYDTLVITPIGSDAKYYWQGEIISFTGSKQITLPDIGGGAHTTGIHYIYFDDATATLKSSTNAWDIDTTIQIAVILWNQNNSSGYKSLLGDERHSVAIPSRARKNWHKSRGTQVLDKGTIAGHTLDSALNSSVTFGIGQCVIIDEDLILTLSQLVDNDGSTAQYCMFYRDSSQNWTWNISNFPFKNATNGRLQKNTATGLVECQNGYFINVYLLLSNYQGSARFAFVISPNEYSSANGCYGESIFDLNLSLPFQEFYAIAQITYGTDNTYTNTGKCILKRILNLDVSSAAIQNLISSVTTTVAAPIPGYKMSGGLEFFSETTLTALLGIYEIGGLTRTRQTDFVVTWSDIENGVTKQASKWYYVYAKEDPNDPNKWIAFISDKAPTKDTYGSTILPYRSGAKYHPTLVARFIGSFRTDLNSNIIETRRSGDWVIYQRLGYDFLVNASAVKDKKIPVVTSPRCPDTSSSVLLYYENSGGTANYKYIGDIEQFNYKYKDGSGKYQLALSPLNYCNGATATASSDTGNAVKAIDGTLGTSWSPATTSNEYLEINFGASYEIDYIELTEQVGTYRTASFNVQYWNGSSWVTLYTGTTIGALIRIQFSKITTQKIRFNLLSAPSGRIKLDEIKAYHSEDTTAFYYQIDGDAINLAVHGYLENF